MPWSHHNKPPPFTPVNYDHPFARELVFFCPLHWCQGYAFDVMQRIDGGAIQTGYTQSGSMYSAGQRGWYWEAPTDPATSELGFAFGSTEASPDSAYSPTHPTICARFRPAFTCSTINGGARVLSKGQVVNNTDDYAIYRDSSLLGRISTRMRGANGEGASLFFDRAAGTWEGVLLDVAAVNDYGVAGSHRGYLWAPEVGEYVEPTPVQGGDNTNGEVATTGEALAIGHRAADERTWQGWIEYAAVFRRPMSREEIRTFMDNPWVIFQDPQSDVSFLSANTGPISYVFGTNTDTTGTSITGIEPAGTQQGDLVLALVQSAETPSTGTWTPPTDFVEIDSFAETTGNKDSHWWLGYKIRGATAGDGYQFDFSGTSDSLSIVLDTFRGVSQSNPLDVTWSRASHYAAYDSGTNDVNTAAQDIVVATDSAWVVLLQAVSRSISGEAAPPSGYTERNDALTSQALNKGLYVCTKLVTDGTENPGVFQHTDVTGDADAKTFTIALRPSGVVETQHQFPQKRTWTTQPPPGTPLDMSHPAMKHCIFVRNGEYKRDLLTGQRPTNTAATGDSLADRRVKANSRGLNYANDSTYIDVYASGGEASDKFDGLSECSIMAVFNADSFTLGNAENRVFMRDNTDGTHANCDFYLDLKEDAGATSAIDACAGFIGEEPNLGGARITAHDVATGKQYSLGARFKSGQTQWVHLWSEGVGHLNDESTNSPAGSLATTKDLWLGGRADAATDDFDGVILFAAAFDSFLPQALFESLLENPYQIFKPRTEYSPYIVQSVVGNVVVITDVANSGETPGSGTETWDDGSTGNVITGTNFL